jgi:hypothetical protein
MRRVRAGLFWSLPHADLVKKTTMLWPDAIHREIGNHAARGGMTFAQYVREATIARWAYELGIAELPDDPNVSRRIEAGLRRIRRLLEEHIL